MVTLVYTPIYGVDSKNFASVSWKSPGLYPITIRPIYRTINYTVPSVPKA